MKSLGKTNELKQTVSTFWDARNQRERNMLTLAIVAIVFGLFYLLLIDPATSGRADLAKKLPVLRQQAAEVQAMAKEASAVRSKTAAAPAVVTKESLEASLARKGLKPENLSVTGELVKLQLSSASFAGTIDWLDEMQRTARLSVVDAKFDAQAQVDTVNATLTLRRGQQAPGG
jgi:general secretion pathway protein M